MPHDERSAAERKLEEFNLQDYNRIVNCGELNYGKLPGIDESPLKEVYEEWGRKIAEEIEKGNPCWAVSISIDSMDGETIDEF